MRSAAAFHGLDSVQRAFAYDLDEESGASAFDATNRLWDQLWNPDVSEPFKQGLDTLTSAIDRLTLHS